MASKYVTDLIEVADQLESDGFPVSSGVCKRAAERMDRMETLITGTLGPSEDEDG